MYSSQIKKLTDILRTISKEINWLDKNLKQLEIDVS